LGLTISKILIEMMGGKIWLQSIPHEGSVFYFTLPLK
jgi:signal transduction histidine kinase